MNSVLLALILMVLVVMVIAQFGFFFWALRRIKQNRPTISAEQYSFICKTAAGVLFLAAAAAATYSAFLLTTGNRTTGVVIELRGKHDDGTELFAPTFRFVDGVGVTNIIDSNTYSSPTHYRVGERIPVVYRRSDPTTARINSFTENWMATIVLTTLGGLALISIPIHKKWRQLRSPKARHMKISSNLPNAAVTVQPLRPQLLRDFRLSRIARHDARESEFFRYSQMKTIKRATMHVTGVPMLPKCRPHEGAECLPD